MTFQIFGTGHLGPMYRPPMLLPTLMPGAADYLAKFAADSGIELAPWQVELLRSLEASPGEAPAQETCDPPKVSWQEDIERGAALLREAVAEAQRVVGPPLVPISAELLDDARKDPQTAATRAHMDESLRRALSMPLSVPGVQPCRDYWNWFGALGRECDLPVGHTGAHQSQGLRWGG